MSATKKTTSEKKAVSEKIDYSKISTEAAAEVEEAPVEVEEAAVEVEEAPVEVEEAPVEVEEAPVEVEEAPVEVEEAPVEEVEAEEAPVEAEPVAYKREVFVMVDIDDVAKVNFREGPSTQAKVLMTLQNKRRLKVLKDEDPEWLFVELGDDSSVRGYIKKMFVKEV